MGKGTIEHFRGLNTQEDRLTLGLDWFTQADNLDINSAAKPSRRAGYSLGLAATPSGAFTTADYSRMFMADAGQLVEVMPDMGKIVLRTGMASAETWFTELNKLVYFTNGVDSGIITPDRQVLPWAWPVPAAPQLIRSSGNLPAGQYQVACTYLLADGRETGTSEVVTIDLAEGESFQLAGISQAEDMVTLVYIAPANSQVFGFAFVARQETGSWNSGPDNLGADLLTHLRAPLPPGATLATTWAGRICVAVYMPAQDQTVVVMSDPLAPHLFHMQSGFFMVPGKALMLAPTDDALIVGTRSKIFARTVEAKLLQLADYGTVPGHNWAADGAKVLLWTTRGVCEALPFVNLTENQISVAPGVRAGAAVIETDGEKRFVVALAAGGTAFNSHS